MKKKVFVNTVVSVVMSQFALLAAFGGVASAENPDHMRQLLRTGDCPGCDLSGANLEGLNLSGANLQAADLSGANFQQTQLLNANMAAANLSNAVLVASDLSGANLENVDLSDVVSAFWCELEFSSSNFSDPNECLNAVLLMHIGIIDFCRGEYGPTDVFLPAGEARESCTQNDLSQNLHLRSRQYIAPRNMLYTLGFRGANLSGANLENADLSGADLRYADLTGAIATNANFQHALLLDAELANVKDANFEPGWNTRTEIGSWLAEHNADKIKALRESDAQQYVNRTGRAQLDYHREQGKLAADAGLIGENFSEEYSGRYYTLGVVLSENGEVALQYALSKAAGLRSYIGIAMPTNSEEPYSPSINICESETADVINFSNFIQSDAAKQVLEGSITCPAEWENESRHF